jgi:acyl-homoserine-lactone acylase
LAKRPISIRYKTAGGKMATRDFTAWMTHRGPIVRADGGRWMAFAMMDRPVEALQQSFFRTKTHDLKGFLKVAAFQANSSNTTIFADSKGEIAYLHPQFVPVRSPQTDYTKAVDGSDPSADWGAITSFKQLPNVVKPPSGYVFNTNNWPWNAAGQGTLRKEAYPAYMDSVGENPRGLHALALLGQTGAWSLDRLQQAAFDPAQPGFALLIPSLIAAYDALPAGDARRASLAQPVAALRGWDTRWSATSIPNTLANYWGAQLWDEAKADKWDDGLTLYDHLQAMPPERKLAAFGKAVAKLKADFGRWDIPWGEVNRFQRLTANIDQVYDDKKPSLAVPFSSARWGSLASFGATARDGTRKWYGDSGNSFVALVEFSPNGVRARAVTAGGESGHPGTPHFDDEAERYATGNLRDVYFYPAQLSGHTERTYHPGE